MKLYYSPGACSLSPHIALRESGLPFELVKVGRDKLTSDGRNFLDINPYGYVPALELDNGEILAEGPAIVQYIADSAPASQQAPDNGTIERYRVQAALAFVSSELHKTLGSLFNPAITDAVKQATIEKVELRLAQLSIQMQGRQWIANDQYSVADAYLFTVLRWLPGFKIDLNRWPILAAHSAQMLARPAVRSALVAEGLLLEETA